MERAYSVLTIKAVDEDSRTITGMASTPTPDRMGDIVQPKGAKFKLPIPLLWQHDTHSPIGHVTKAKVTETGIEIIATIAKGVSDEIDRQWNLIKSRLVQGLSIGFRGLDEEAIPNSWGTNFKSWEWLELSAVTIPANSEATIQTIKQFDIGAPVAQGHRRSAGDVPPGATGKSTATKPVKLLPKEGTKMKQTIAEQISAFDATRQVKAAERDKLLDDSAEKGETFDAEQAETYKTLDSEVKQLEEHISLLREREKSLIQTAKAVNGDGANGASQSRQTGVIQVRQVQPKGTGFVRLLAARFMAMEDGCSAYDIAVSRGWGQDLADLLKTPKSVIKAAVSVASTTDTAWAGPLVTYNNLQSEFLELLRPRTLIGRIPGLRAVPFNVKVPRETGETTGYWVGQGSPKPVSKGALDTVTLDFNKVAGITYLTQELLRFSQPSAEALMINSLTKAIIKLMDNDFLDPSKAVVTGVSPASITNTATPITATGTTADAFRSDFGRMLAQYTTANYSMDDLVIVMGQTQAFRLGLLRNDFGSKEFPDINKDGGSIEGVPVVTSENVAANGGSPADGRIIVALAANSILIADDGGVEVDVSTQASLQVDDAPDSPTTASTTMISLWQQNMVGIRCERFVTWVKARTGAVQYISGGNYG